MSDLLYICFISLAVRAMRCFFVLPVHQCGAFVSKLKGYVETSNVWDLSHKLNVNVFGDLTTCKFCPKIGSRSEKWPEALGIHACDSVESAMCTERRLLVLAINRLNRTQSPMHTNLNESMQSSPAQGLCIGSGRGTSNHHSSDLLTC